MELLEVSAHDALVFFCCRHRVLPRLIPSSRNSATPGSSAPLRREALFTRVRGRASPKFAGTEFSAPLCLATPRQGACESAVRLLKTASVVAARIRPVGSRRGGPYRATHHSLQRPGSRWGLPR